MSVLSDKSDIFQKIAIIKTASQASINNNSIINFVSSFESSKTAKNKDPFLFIIDLLKVLTGSDASKIIITTIFNSINKIENSFKGSLKNEIVSLNGGGKSNPPLPSNFTQGFQLHVNKIDFFNQLVPSNSSNGMYLDSFGNQLVNSIKSPNQSVAINPVLNASFDSNSGYFTFKPSVGGSLNSYMSSLIDNVKFVDTDALIKNVLGGIFNSDNKDADQLSIEAQIDLMLNKLATQQTDDDSYFTFTTDELGNIQSTLNNGGNMVTQVGNTGLTAQISNDDINQITSGVQFPISSNVLNQTLNNTVNVLYSNNAISQKDKQSVSNNFISNFLNAIKTQVIRKFMASPQINIIYALSQSFITIVDSDLNPVNDIINRKNLTKCLIKKLLSDLIEAIFQLIEKEIITLVSELALIYIEEGIDKYKKILKSLA